MVFRAVEAWQAASDAACVVVVKDGRVFDPGTVARLDWGVPARELRWRAPEATVRLWDDSTEARAVTTLTDLLMEWGTSVAVLDSRRAIVEWPRPAQEDWAALVRRTVPAYARRIQGGLAPHPLLAQWVARAGAALRLPAWETGTARLYRCDPAVAGAVWKTMPLSAVPASAAERRQWRQAGATRVGDVPNLATRLARMRTTAPVPRPVTVEKRWPEGLSTGVSPALEELAGRLAGRLAQGGWRTRRLRLGWEPERGEPVVRQRVWPYAAQSAAVLFLRALELTRPQPAEPPVALRLTADMLTPAEPEQLAWWERPPERLGVDMPRGTTAGSWRELRLGFWDPWRQRS